MLNNDITRFFDKVDKSSECWLWTASISSNGYGQISMNGSPKMAHRISWIIHNGPIPKGDGYHGTCVLHRCDVRTCVNPDHLFLGSQRDNLRDMGKKGRKSGIKNAAAKLNNAKVIAIRADSRIHRLIAADYGVCKTAITLIKQRKRWAHI